jgi:Pyridoxamine 5'-phosphate oxidase
MPGPVQIAPERDRFYLQRHSPPILQYHVAVMARPRKKPNRLQSPKPGRPHMPGYGMPEGSKGLLPWTWAEQRLKKSHNYWITTVKPDGSPHTMVVWGLWQDGRFLFSTGSKSRKARNLAKNRNCVVCNERAHEAVVVEGIAEIADVSARRKFLPVYERKYKFDMKGMKDDILSMKEPIFAVRPQVVFGLWEKHFQSKSTRWKFE